MQFNSQVNMCQICASHNVWMSLGESQQMPADNLNALPLPVHHCRTTTVFVLWRECNEAMIKNVDRGPCHMIFESLEFHRSGSMKEELGIMA